MTPDHLHATIALAAMKAGKHVIVHKPLGNVLHEARLVIQTARETGAATHMFCSAGHGVDGADHRVDRGRRDRPGARGAQLVVAALLAAGHDEPPDRERCPSRTASTGTSGSGPCPHRPYHPAYTNAVFRGWYDFGTGALGDMGHYSFFQVFKILKLGSPLTVEASRSQSWKIDDLLWKKQVNTVSYPHASLVRWEFPERAGMPPVALHWYDGGLRPPKPRELEEDGESMPEEGLLFVGDGGKILADFMGRNPRLIPKARMQAFQPPPQTLPRPGRGARAVGPRLPGHRPLGRQLRERGGHQRDDPAGHDRPARREEAAVGRGGRRGSSTLRRPTPS